MKTTQLFIMLMAGANIFTMDTFESITNIERFERDDADRRGISSNKDNQTSKCPFMFKYSNESISEQLINHGSAIARNGLTDFYKEISHDNNPSTKFYNAFNAITETTFGAGVATIGYTVQAVPSILKLAQQNPKEACVASFIAASFIANQYINCSSCNGQDFTK